MKAFIDYGIALRPSATGEVKIICPQCSASRKKRKYPCLNVNVDKGVWNCWHCGWSGSLKGGQQHRPEIRKVYTLPNYSVPNTGLPGDATKWFAGRGITPEVLKRNRIGHGPIYIPQVEEEVSAVQFPYLRGDYIVNVKYRDGRKNFRMAAGAERVLYGLNDMAETTVWVEGEMDKLSLEVAGYPNCVSVPDGTPAPDSRNYDTKFDFLAAPELAKVKTHILAVDSDPPGKRLQQELARRLGAENCLLVEWPTECKDANEVLIKHGKDVLAQCIRDAKPLPIVGAYDVADLIGDFEQLFDHGLPRGVSTGWSGLDRHYTVQPGEWTLVLRKGIRVLVIDTWNEIENARTAAQTETEYISLTLSRIRQFARANGVHVWLVAHPAKLFKEASGKYPVPTPYDVSGSAHWRNKADNCIAIWRDQPDPHNCKVEIHVQKIRHKITGQIGMVVLTYDVVTGRYFDGAKSPATLVRDIEAAATNGDLDP